MYYLLDKSILHIRVYINSILTIVNIFFKVLKTYCSRLVLAIII